MPGRHKKRPASPQTDDATSIAQSRTRRARRSSVAASESDSHDSYQRRRGKRTKTTHVPVTSRRRRADSTSDSVYDDESSQQAEESIEDMVNRIRREREAASKTDKKKQVVTRRSSKTGIATRRASSLKTDSRDNEEIAPKQPELKPDPDDESTKDTDKEKDNGLDKVNDPADGDTKKKDQVERGETSKTASEGKEPIDLTGETPVEVSVPTITTGQGELPPAPPRQAGTKPTSVKATATKSVSAKATTTKSVSVKDAATKSTSLKDPPVDPGSASSGKEEKVVSGKDQTQTGSEATLDDKTKGAPGDTTVHKKTANDKDKRQEKLPPTKESKEKIAPKKSVNLDGDQKLATTTAGISEQTSGSAKMTSATLVPNIAGKSNSLMPVSKTPVSAEEKSSTGAKMATRKEVVVPERKGTPKEQDPKSTKSNDRAAANKARADLSVIGGAKIEQEAGVAATNKSEAKILPHSSLRNVTVHSRKADAAMVGSSLSPPPALFKHVATKSVTKPAIVDLTGDDDNEESSHRPATDSGHGTEPLQKDTKTKDAVAARSLDTTLTKPKLLQGSDDRKSSRLSLQTDASREKIATENSETRVRPVKEPPMAKREEQKDNEAGLKESRTNPSTKQERAGRESIPAITANSNEHVKSSSAQKAMDNDAEKAMGESVNTSAAPTKKPGGAQKTEPTVATATEESAPIPTRNVETPREKLIKTGEQVASIRKEATNTRESEKSGSGLQVTVTGELASEGKSEMASSEQIQSSSPLKISGTKRKEREVSTVIEEKMTAPVQTKHKENNSSIPPKIIGTEEADKVAASKQSSKTTIGISKSSGEDQSTGIQEANMADGDVVPKSLTEEKSTVENEIASKVGHTETIPATGLQTSTTENQETAASMQIGENDKKEDETPHSVSIVTRTTGNDENTDTKTPLASIVGPPFQTTTASAPEPKSDAEPSATADTLVLDAELHLGKPGTPSSTPMEVTTPPSTTAAMLADSRTEAIKPQPLVQENVSTAQLADHIVGIVSPKEGIKQSPTASQLTEGTAVNEAAKVQAAKTHDATRDMNVTQRNDTPKSTATRDIDLLTAQREVPPRAVEEGANAVLPAKSHGASEASSHIQPDHNTTTHTTQQVEVSRDILVEHQSMAQTTVLPGSVSQSSCGDVGNTVATNETEVAPGNNPSQTSSSKSQEPFLPAEPESLTVNLQQPLIRSVGNQDVMEDTTPALLTGAVENVATADEDAASSQPSSNQAAASDRGEKRPISTDDSCVETAGLSKKPRMSDEPVERAPSPVKVVRVDLARLKALIFATGRRVHKGTRYGELFLKYWTALSRRLCENLSTEQFKQCQVEIKSFLKSKKLRILHNKMILDVSTMPDSLRQRITPVNPQRTHKSRESKNRRNQKARPKSVGRTVQPIMRTGMKPNLGSSRIPGSLAIDPYLRKSTASTGMKITENAVWLVSIAMREYAKSLLSDTLLTAKAMDSGVVPPIPKIGTKVQTMQQPNPSAPNPSAPIDRTLQRTDSSKFLLPSDLHTIVEQLPIGARSLNGHMSRVTYERSLHASQSSTAPHTRKLDKVRNFLVGKIVQTETKRPAPRVSAPAKTTPSLPENPAVVVPPPAAAVAVKVAEVLQTQLPEQKVQTKASVPAPVKAASAPPPDPSQKVTPKVEIQQETAGIPDDKKISLIKGLGRGAKDLAALKARAVSKTPETTSESEGNNGAAAAAAAAVVAPTEQPLLDGENESSTEEQESHRKGKGTGTKDLAAMMARKKDDAPDSDDGSEKNDEPKPAATSESGPTTKDDESKQELDQKESSFKAEEAGCPSEPKLDQEESSPKPKDVKTGSLPKPKDAETKSSPPVPKDMEAASSSKPKGKVEEVAIGETGPTKEEKKEVE